jgi:hypothetical protein
MFSYGLNAVLVLTIAVWLLSLIRIWRKGEWEQAAWTSDDRKHVRTLRVVMLGLTAVAWAVALVAIARRPALFHELMATAANPVLLTVLALTFTSPITIESLRPAWGIRNLMITAAIVGVFLLAGSLLTLATA